MIVSTGVWGLARALAGIQEAFLPSCFISSREAASSFWNKASAPGIRTFCLPLLLRPISYH